MAIPANAREVARDRNRRERTGENCMVSKREEFKGALAFESIIQYMS